MKQIILLLILSAFGFEAHTQIANGDFENWETIDVYDQPIGYFTANRSQHASNISGFITPEAFGITKVAGTNGGSAVRLETTNQGLALPGTFGTDIYKSGPETYPYTGTPSQVSVIVRYSCGGMDSSDYLFKFYKNNVAINEVNFKTGGEQLAFNPVTVDLPAFSEAPDAVEISIRNSDFSRYDTWLEIDQIEFIGTAEQLPNNSFDNWETVTYNEAVDWGSSNFATQPLIETSGVSQSSDAATGLSSIRIEAISREELNNINPNQDFVVSTFNARISAIGEDIFSGSPVSGSDQINFMYKFAGGADEFGQVRAVVLNSAGQGISTNEMTLPATDIWTSMSLSINPTGAESVVIAFIPGVDSDGTVNRAGGAVLMIDDVNLGLATATQDLEELDKFTAYYNKSASEINLRFAENIEQGQLSIYQINGSQLINRSFENRLELNQPISDFPAGIYLIDIITPEKRGSVRLFVD